MDITQDKKKYSLKRLFTIWLPMVWLCSSCIALALIFFIGEVTYFGSAYDILSVTKGIWWQNVLFIGINAAQYAGAAVNTTILISASIALLVAEFFCIRRLIKLRRIEHTGLAKTALRVLALPLWGIAAAAMSAVAIYGISFGLAFAYGYIDIRKNLTESLQGVITENVQILHHIQDSSGMIEIYDAAGSAGVVLARRDIRRRKELHAYEGVILPLLAKFIGKDTEGKSFFVPETNSIVYTHFAKGGTERIMTELVHNRLKYNQNRAIAAAFAKTRKPAVLYLNETEYDAQRRRINSDSARKSEFTLGSYVSGTSNILIRITEDQEAVNYFATLLHETLHYYSQGGVDLPHALNEGITDYLTYKSFEFSDYEMVEISGYFREIQIIMALLEKIPEPELITAYLANDATLFKKMFKKYFPEANYETFLKKSSAIYEETYEKLIAPVPVQFGDTDFDTPSIRDMRIFLGLTHRKFNPNLD